MSLLDKMKGGKGKERQQEELDQQRILLDRLRNNEQQVKAVQAQLSDLSNKLEGIDELKQTLLGYVEKLDADMKGMEAIKDGLAKVNARIDQLQQGGVQFIPPTTEGGDTQSESASPEGKPPPSQLVPQTMLYTLMENSGKLERTAHQLFAVHSKLVRISEQVMAELVAIHKKLGELAARSEVIEKRLDIRMPPSPHESEAQSAPKIQLEGVDPEIQERVKTALMKVDGETEAFRRQRVKEVLADEFAAIKKTPAQQLAEAKAS